MRTFYLLLTGLLFYFGANAQTAITLSNTNMPGSNDTLRYTNVQTSSVPNYTQTGANFNWNFGSVVSTGNGLRQFKSALQTPYAFYFLSSGEYGEKIADTLVGGTGSITITQYYNFYKKQTSPVNAFVADGSGMTISGIPVPSYYSDKDEMYMFPMTFPKYDSTTFKFSTITTTLIPIKYSKAGYRVTVVDGWGSVTTPYGTENCLRLITTQYSNDTTMITLPIPGFPPIKIGIKNYVRSYQWMTVNSKIPYFEVTGNLLNNNFTVTQMRYRGYDKTIVTPPIDTRIDELTDISGMTLYPNPVHDRLWFAGKADKDASLEIYDTQGKLIRKAAFEQVSEVLYVDVNQLQPGLYVLKCVSGAGTQYSKFIKE